MLLLLNKHIIVYRASMSLTGSGSKNMGKHLGKNL